MANEVGSIYVSVLPTTAGLTRSMNTQITGAFSSSASAGENIFRRLFSRVAAFGAGVLATIGLGRLVRETVSLGIEYNTLLQTSRAAFTTILGSSEAASDMLASIKELSLQTPFPRQAYIKAAQQMTAFGIESGKVIPYLDAITDAVAAAGGNSQTLSEIAFVMSQISAAGKITGIDLIQFGQRGINAAVLIGSQMGKTGAEIREMITAGALDANVALDALAAGMKQTYDGAAANVKNTFLGAIDRVKGASRDLSGALLEPFIDPNGGGYLTEWANLLADSLRAIESSPALGILQDRFRAIGAAIDPFVKGIASTFALLNEENGVAKFSAAVSETFPLLGFLTTIASSLQPVLPALGTALLAIAKALLSEGVLDALTKLIVEVLPPLADLLVEIAPLIPPLAELLGAVLPAAIDLLRTNSIEPLLIALAGLEVFFGSKSITQFADELIASGTTIGQFALAISQFITTVINTLIDGLNGVGGMVETFINSISGLLGLNATVTLPDIERLSMILSATVPKLAESGTVLPRPGGTLILAAEAGRAESVVDTGKLNDLMAAAASTGGAGSPTFIVNPRADQSEERIARVAVQAYNNLLRGLG